MAINFFQGTTPSLYVNLSTCEGTPYNASGCVLYFTAKQDYSSSSYLFNIGVTGLNGALSNATTGLFVFSLTTGDTSHCAQNYPAQFTLIDTNSGITKTAVDGGVNILPSVLVL